MNTVTQITRRRQAIIEYSLKKGVTAAARRYNVSRQFIYRRKKDMTKPRNRGFFCLKIA